MKNKPLIIYLGDLTYDTIALSTEVFPLNIGFIASYCKKLFGSDVEITLFKYIDELENAIQKSPPNILGLSNYAWNHRLGIEIFRIMRNKNPNTLRVYGGPNFPADIKTQEKFLNEFPEIDIYVPIEGETGFSNIVKRLMECESEEQFRKQVIQSPIDGCISRTRDGKLQYSNSIIRINALDDIPSPYVDGTLDKFFDGRLTPMIQTNRGCPFSCTFCTDGKEEVSRVNQFSVDHIKEEISYIGQHVPNNIHSLEISDLNFGMFPKDLEVCDTILEIQEKYGYPNLIQATTGKNRQERVIQAITKLKGSLRLMMSVQSMDEQVLKNIRRDNISVEKMIGLAPTIKKNNLRTTSEVILGLPGESYESHLETLKDLARAGMDFVRPYTLMLIHGSELSTPIQREKWGFKTKFRILPKDFTILSNGKKIMEIEEVVISSNTLKFEEYVELRTLAFIMFVSNIGILYDAILKLLREYNIDVFELFHRTLKQESQAPDTVKKCIEGFRNATIKELWDSPEEVERHYQKDENYQKLLDGIDGINVIQHFHGLVTAKHMDDWTFFTMKLVEELFIEQNISNQDLKNQISDIGNYCFGIGHNLMSKNRMETNPEFEFDYDIKSWLGDETNTLAKHKFNNSKKMVFELTDKQFKLVEDELNIRGYTDVGLSHALKHIPTKLLLRQSKILQ
jgi:radical SAM superfamily enzyme YgiQ (UPF0313 family)